MASHGQLRASDADRDRVVERLRHAATEGRLSADELDERVHCALTARTYSELAATTRDLPASRRSAPQRAVTSRRERRPAPQRHTVGGLAVSALRANPLLFVVLVPLVAVTGSMLIAASAVWGVFMVILLALGARVHGGPWSLIWEREPRDDF